MFAGTCTTGTTNITMFWEWFDGLQTDKCIQFRRDWSFHCCFPLFCFVFVFVVVDVVLNLICFLFCFVLWLLLLFVCLFLWFQILVLIQFFFFSSCSEKESLFRVYLLNASDHTHNVTSWIWSRLLSYLRWMIPPMVVDPEKIDFRHFV